MAAGEQTFQVDLAEVVRVMELRYPDQYRVCVLEARCADLARNNDALQTALTQIQTRAADSVPAAPAVVDGSLAEQAVAGLVAAEQPSEDVPN